MPRPKGSKNVPKTPKTQPAKSERAIDRPKLDASDLKLQAALQAVEGKHGKGAIMLAGATDHMKVDRIPSQHIGVDDILGGGWPRGRILEIFGPPSSGKTTLTLDIIRCFQRAGFRAAFVDVEHALDPTYAQTLGVDTDELLISQPDSAEQALDIVDVLVKSDALGIVVVDSIDALVTKAELEGDIEDSHVGRLPRLMSRMCRILTKTASKTNCLIVMVNQERDNIAPGGYGPKKTTSGGRALPYYASVRLEIKKKETLTKVYGGDKVATGIVSEVKAVKNKVGIPYKKCEIQIDFPDEGVTPGINRIAPIIDAALESGVLKKSGSWFAIGKTNIAQGLPALQKKLAADPELLSKLQGEQ